jgi:transcriptional regulator with XRE-family HTH domain
MPTPPADDFIAWLDAELAQRRWNYGQLARRAGLAHSVFSRARAGVAPGWRSCCAIAEALGLPPEPVLRRAGLLPPLPADQAEFEQFRHLLAQLSPAERQELMEIARIKLRLTLDRQGN